MQTVYTTHRWMRLAFLLAALMVQSAGVLAQPAEDCANGLDDDGDGLADLNDPDCSCEVIEPVSIIPNPSFEDLDCCPQSRSQLDCAEVWIQASEPTTDLINNCGYPGWEGLLPVQPFPDGDGILGFRDGRPQDQFNGQRQPNWKEYAGACLLDTMRAGVTYRFEFDLGFVNDVNSPDIRISFFGTTDCSNLPFGQGNENLGCPTNGPGWSRLGSVGVSTVFQGGWRKATIEVTPVEDIVAMAIGPDCVERPRDVPLYYFFDNLLLADLESFTFVITETDHPCSPNHRLEVPARNGVNYQWYKEGVALVGETAARLGASYGEGSYRAVLDNNSFCQQTESFEYRIPVATTTDRRVICSGDTYTFGDRRLGLSGDYEHIFTDVNGCDSTVFMELVVLGELNDTVTAKIFPGESVSVGFYDIQQAGEYNLALSSSIGCDSLVFLDLAYYQVYRPTAFSPNADGVNDVFTLSGNDDLAEVRDLRIFDRWGTLLSEGTEWDGTRNGEPNASGLYVYTVTVIMDDGVGRQLTGSVMLVR